MYTMPVAAGRQSRSVGKTPLLTLEGQVARRLRFNSPARIRIICSMRCRPVTTIGSHPIWN